MSSKEVTALENNKQDTGEETMLKGEDKDGDVPKAKENDEMMKEEAENAPTETQAWKDAERLNTTKLKEVVFHSAYSCVFVCVRLCALLTEWVCLFSTTVIITALITQGNCG